MNSYVKTKIEFQSINKFNQAYHAMAIYKDQMGSTRQTDDSGRNICAVPICNSVKEICIFIACDQKCRLLNPLQVQTSSQKQGSRSYKTKEDNNEINSSYTTIFKLIREAINRHRVIIELYPLRSGFTRHQCLNAFPISMDTWYTEFRLRQDNNDCHVQIYQLNVNTNNNNN